MFSFANKAPDDETCLNMFKYLCAQLKSAGFEHYEISNFAKGGFRSLHNTSYWTGIPYLGLGAGAHSFNGKERFWNNEIKVSGDNIVWSSEKEKLSERDIFNELILTSLRTKEGIDTGKVNKYFAEHFNKIADKYCVDGLLKRSESGISLTEKGIFLSDMIIRDFFIP